MKINQLKKSGISRLLKTNLLFLLIAMISSGCSTKKNTSTSRAYHNLTARYNVYFNGNESLKSGLRQAKKTYKEDFSKLLPVFRYEDKNYSSSVSSEMDLAIKKCAKTIKTHSITAKPKIDNKKISKEDKELLSRQEYCNLIDDAYLLMGKAHFYKREFETALQTFMLIINKFKLESSADEALLWIAKTYAETGEYKNAENALTDLKKSKKLDNDFIMEMDLIRASMYLKQKDYINSALKLGSAITLEKKKKEKARHIFLLAQIYQYDNRYKPAADNYKKVIRINPDYDMTFAANIHLAEMYEKSGASIGDLKKKLFKMIKDEKNIDYLDQLYYAMGKIELGEKNYESAINYFNLSAQSASSGNSQKVKTFFALANFYYENKNYKLAEAYYDSTINSMDKGIPDYDILNKNNINHRDLCHNLFEIEKEDSLQFLAKLPETERNKIIDAIIQDIIDQEKKQAEVNNNSEFDPYLIDNSDYQTNNPMEGGKYYFYNPSVISIGQTEFKKKWGDRKLEDNWRRNDKQSFTNEPDIAVIADTLQNKSQQDKQKISDVKSRDYYLQEIPLTPEKLEESNKRIEMAYLSSGEIYFKEFNETEKAIYQFEKLLIRFPQSTFKFDAMRYLYTINNKIMNFESADKYKQLIVKEFPESAYAKMLADPGYLDSLIRRQSEVEKLYSFAYYFYKNKEFTKTINYCDNAEKEFPENELQPNFIYLRGLSYGEIGNKAKLKENLEKIVKEYPQSEPAQNAASTLEIINSKKFEKEIYTFNKDSLHYYAVVYPKDKVDANKLRFKFIKLNAESYTQSDISISIQTLDPERDVLVVLTFKNSSEALNYFQSVIIKNVLEDIQKFNPLHFVISTENFRIYMKNKQDDKYMNFFDKNYLIN